MSVNNNLQVGSGRIRVSRFTASGSWVAPAGVFSVRALAVGGGGGGGATRSNSSLLAYTGGGGGGGGVIDDIFPVVPGTTYTVTIGTGGAGANTSAAGANGTNTTFGSLFTAPGGQGGVSYLINDSFVPTSNPGGSMGGWGFVNGSSALVSAGHGNGAATPILMAAVSSALAVGDAVTTQPFTFYNGITNVTIPVPFIYETASPFDSSHGAIYNASRTATTRYLGVKRNDNPFVPDKTSWIPGYSWKGLGAGGASLLTIGTCGSAIVTNSIYLEPSAGFVPMTRTQVPNANSTIVNGTNGQDNTGAGGGGSVVGGTSNTIASGGTGGSGYVEVVWQE
jgi:hypothetical protein